MSEGIAQAAAATITAYLLSKAAAFDADPDLRTISVTLRLDKKSGQLVPGYISHRTESEGAIVNDRDRRAAASPA